ncbi:MAG TPA: tRNA pseudouridine(38-40) synthase TruA [Thermoanaerobaculia bacterium]|nr:tRNA pseudouridine(38-40) synthase TruA [Thermoanaerobaculia bacterium]
MPTWKLVVEYDGTRYHGWQSQKNADRTVQGVLIRAARELLGEDAAVGGAGRTDSGVHALAQVAHLRARKASTPREIEFGLNDRLPFDVNVLSVEPAPPDFHARHDAVSRTYLYRISRRRTAFDKRLVWWVKDRLDARAMSAAAELLVGRHDFAAFCENPEGRESTVVVVTRSEFETGDEELRYRITASHFLWKMVRRIVGTLVEVGRGELSPDSFAGLLRERGPGATAKWTAPPSGLFLEAVEYAGGGFRGVRSGRPTRSPGGTRDARGPSAPSRPRRERPGLAGGSRASRPARGR